MTSFLPSPFWFTISGVSCVVSIMLLAALCDFYSCVNVRQYMTVVVCISLISVFCFAMGFRAPDKIVVENVVVPNDAIERVLNEKLHKLISNMSVEDKYKILTHDAPAQSN